jgi:hypothetical protein
MPYSSTVNKNLRTNDNKQRTSYHNSSAILSSTFSFCFLHIWSSTFVCRDFLYVYFLSLFLLYLLFLLNPPLSWILRGNLLKWDIITGSVGMKRERDLKPPLLLRMYNKVQVKYPVDWILPANRWNNLTRGKILVWKERGSAFNPFKTAIWNETG